MNANGCRTTVIRAARHAAPVARANRLNASHGPGPSSARRLVRAVVMNCQRKRARVTVHDATEAINAIECSETLAASKLLPLVYDELRKLAAKKLAQEKPGQTLDPTGLVHEAYLRLVKDSKAGIEQSGEGCWANQRHFFAAGAGRVRRILGANALRQ